MHSLDKKDIKEIKNSTKSVEKTDTTVDDQTKVIHEMISRNLNKIGENPDTRELSGWIVSTADEYCENRGDDLGPTELEEFLRETITEGLVKLGVDRTKIDTKKLLTLKDTSTGKFKDGKYITKRLDEGNLYQVLFDDKSTIGTISSDEYNLNALPELNAESLDMAIGSYLEANLS